jgi:DHA1 family tetracycline resistance protein-like MFS transporter
MTDNFFKKMFPLLLVLFIDSMGMGLFFPVLSSLIIDPSLHFLHHDYSTQSRQFIYGVILSIYMFAWFFGAAILGDISDFIGRKKSLLICLLGAALGYFCAGLAVTFKSLTFMIIGRLIAGFTAGSQAIAQAAIVDVSTDTTKSRNMSWMIFTLSLGFLVGPVIGGVLSSAKVLPWFNYSMPMYFAMLISLINMGLLVYFFDETFIPTQKFKLRWMHAINIFTSAFKHKEVRGLSLVLLLMQLGWGAYFSFIVTFLVILFHFTALESGLFLALMAVGFSSGSGLFNRLCLKWMSLTQSVIVNFMIAGSMILLMVLTQSLVMALITAVVDGAAIAIVYANILTLFSNQVSREEQGWVMGMTGAVGAFSFGLIALVGSLISLLGINAPLVVGGLCLIAGGIVLKYLPVQEKSRNLMIG